jgi:hypothetical protein
MCVVVMAVSTSPVLRTHRTPRPRQERLWHRALAAAVDTIAPPAAELVAAGARHLLERQHGTHCQDSPACQAGMPAISCKAHAMAGNVARACARAVS